METEIRLNFTWNLLVGTLRPPLKHTLKIMFWVKVFTSSMIPFSQTTYHTNLLQITTKVLLLTKLRWLL